MSFLHARSKGWSVHLALLTALVLVSQPGCSHDYPPRDTRSDIIKFSKIDRANTLSKGRGVSVAVIDWQFDMHSTAADRFVHATSVVPGENIGEMKPWHGGWMATLVNDVAPEATIIPINARSLKQRGYQEALALGIRYAADHGAVAVSSSMGPAQQSQSLLDAIEYAEQRGTVFVNVHPELVEPPHQEKRFCLGNECDPRIVRTGIVSVPPHKLKPEPARDVYTWPYDLESNYKDGWGFSNAPPVVAGVIALMKSANPTLTPQQVREILTRTAAEREGFRVLDAEAAVRAAVAALPKSRG